MIFLKTKNFTLLASFSLAIVGCAGNPQKTTSEPPPHAVVHDNYSEKQAADDMTNHAANVVGADYFVDLQFTKGSQELTEKSLADITALLQRAEKDGPLDEIMVASWADQELPSQKLDKLTQKQRNLANDRNKNIKKYLKTLTKVHIDTYNMAQQPSSLQKWLRTGDVKLKRSLIAAGTSYDGRRTPISSESVARDHPR